jgi:TolB-like protein
MSIVTELKRRNVFRVGAAYLVVAWLIAQVSELVLGSFGAPDWIIKSVLFLLAVGFPVALIFAWTFELTPDGIKRDTEASRDEPTNGIHGRKLDFVIIASLLLALGYFAWERQELNTTTAFTDRTIAVLPFVNRSGIAEQEWFADGLTEEIINSLTRTPDLQVTSSTSSFAYKNSSEDVRTISESLGVAHILEGSVRRSAEALRIAVQLIRASDGLNLWSATFDRTNDDVIAVQEEIAIEIANALQTAIDPESLAAMVSAGTHSVPAYEAYLKGLALEVNAYLSVDRSLFMEADGEFARAVTIDPEFSTAHYHRAFIWLSQLYENNPFSGASGLSIEEMEKFFYESIDQAIKHEDDVAVRTRYRARRSWIDMDFRQALQQYNEYLKLRPGDEEAMWDRFIVVRSLGLHDQAIKLALEIVEAGVKPSRVNYQALQAMMYVMDPDAIVSNVKAMINRVPDDIYLKYQAHKAFLWAMDVDAARDMFLIIVPSNYPKSPKALAQLRQACAEERISDALRFHAEAIESSDRLVVIWLAHMIIGEEEKADSVLTEYDQQGNFHNLAGLLQYGAFDPKILPNFMARLAGQRIEERQVFEIPFRCNR